jgi:hypothetical protein
MLFCYGNFRNTFGHFFCCFGHFHYTLGHFFDSFGHFFNLFDQSDILWKLLDDKKANSKVHQTLKLARVVYFCQTRLFSTLLVSPFESSFSKNGIIYLRERSKTSLASPTSNSAAVLLRSRSTARLNTSPS